MNVSVTKKLWNKHLEQMSGVVSLMVIAEIRDLMKCRFFFYIPLKLASEITW